jgi:16S rRNA (cytidine1402-2'-O)-methyltransferase
MIFYEAPHRIVEAMRDIAATFGEDRRVVLCRELTKRFETIHHCLSGEAVGWLEADDNQQRGEFVVILEGRQVDESNSDDGKIRDVLSILLQELPVKQAVALATKITGAKRNAVYAAALELKDKPP